MANPATIIDVAARWRPLTDDETIIGTTLLDDAWALLKLRVPDVEPRLAAIPATLDVVLVRMVIVAMVLRVMRNPDGLRQETIQDYSYTRDSGAASGMLTISGDELDLLTPATSGTAFTITPYGVAGYATGDECL